MDQSFSLLLTFHEYFRQNVNVTTFSKFSAPTIAFLAFWLVKKTPTMRVLRHMENSAPSLKIFRTKFSTSALYNCGNKNRRQNPVWEFTKTITPFALVGYEVIITNSRYALVGYFISSYPTRAHGIIVMYIYLPSHLFSFSFAKQLQTITHNISLFQRKNQERGESLTLFFLKHTFTSQLQNRANLDFILNKIVRYSSPKIFKVSRWLYIEYLL